MMLAAIVAALVLPPAPPPPLLDRPRHKYDYRIGRKRLDGGIA